ncbi:unnamed protein product [Thlaspi arvense]|uniref:Uncharacterized protein n=1 Tax=Thlaspi arvense TaxID=13288 RepID=A0AAU9RUJ5_THLAR|nr:unnamed protein product [Thlaspi arvense]
MAKEKQVLIDLEQRIKQNGFSDNEPPEMILDVTKENETGSGIQGAAQEAMVSTTTKSDSLSEPAIPGLWSSTFSKDYCCIYRVPNPLRRVKPEAYTPQMLLIGPLHHYKKAEAPELSKTDLRYLDYMNMERHKKKYLTRIANIYGETIDEFRRIIQIDEIFIRKSYAESTDWIRSQEFQEMILYDWVFILWFFIQTGTGKIIGREDILFEEPYLITTILQDLMLLENQLPFALLEKLFEPFVIQLQIKETFRDITLRVFRFEGKIKKEVKFRHFTDLLRRVRVETLGLSKEDISRAKAEPTKSIRSLYSASQLESAGVDFAPNMDDLSLVIKFEAGILRMPCLIVEDNNERVIRNLMALELCHYPSSAFVCNYIVLLDFLNETEQDTDLLIKKGVIRNWSIRQDVAMATEMYYYIAESLNRNYRNKYKRIGYYEYRIRSPLCTLRQVYFKDLWSGTATVGAVVIVVLTLIGTVASVLQVKKNSNNATKSTPPPPSKP